LFPLVGERGNGVHISRNQVKRYLRHHGNLAALKFSRGLDDSVRALLTAAAGQVEKSSRGRDLRFHSIVAARRNRNRLSVP
jgi:hypothetical protein